MPRLTVGGAEIGVLEAGTGTPVVLLHCSAGSAAQWRRLSETLAGHHRVLAPHLHGHGDSDPWPGPGPLALAAEGAIVAALGERAGEPVHLVGHSYGGAVALRFAWAHPDHVRSLTLIEPVAFPLLRDSVAPDDGAALRSIEALAAAVARGDMGSFVDFWNGDGAWAALPEERRAGLSRLAGTVAGHFGAADSEARHLRPVR
ncbi:MAG: alpha/beta fold hydrolase, partial [Acetobacteraceae bacterium]|nr:alpha/beta fold hydrolase [Acetobacteraceae bacterium]